MSWAGLDRWKNLLSCATPDRNLPELSCAHRIEWFFFKSSLYSEVACFKLGCVERSLFRKIDSDKRGCFLRLTGHIANIRKGIKQPFYAKRARRFIRLVVCKITSNLRGSINHFNMGKREPHCQIRHPWYIPFFLNLTSKCRVLHSSGERLKAKKKSNAF